MNPKDVLTKGAVKPWHVIFIVLVAYAVGGVAAEKLVRSLDPGLAFSAKGALSVSIAGAILIVYTVVVPEFRRVLPILFRRPRVSVSAIDVCAMAAIAICWGDGLYRAGFMLPALQSRPEWFQALALNETMPPFKARYLMILASIAILAPLAEELIFRGFLLNLWAAHRGTWLAILGSSAFFGLMHGTWALFAAPLGVVFALAYLKYDSLWPGIALHAAYNFLAFDWMLGRFFCVKDRATVQDPSNWIPEITLAILFFPAAWFFWKRFKPRS